MTEKGPWGSPDGAPRRDAQENIIRGIRSELRSSMKTIADYEVEEDFTSAPRVTFRKSDDASWPAVEKKIEELAKDASGLAKKHNYGDVQVRKEADGKSVIVEIV